ncbi:uncharacterized protein LOC126419288 isoform X1 [Schistocerca serialis cubense]|uniref:uncharacterized protein LOC126419288 isoform X1 n=1 Tax=Schistocerca serialis cubense TaxID=2023355 RepID=UPI00214EA988|nr:uncharacterized protein LOC126419288 isoform X1 [Schistocerca serialis cubense]
MPPIAASAVAAASLLLLVVDTANLPAEFSVCKRNAANMEKCVQAALQDVTRHLSAGTQSLGVVPLDPLQVPQINIHHVVKYVLKIRFRNVRLTGLANADVSNVTADVETDKLSLVAEAPHILFESDYDMLGKFIEVFVVGSGKCKFVFGNVTAQLRLESERVQRECHVHWRPQRFALEVLSLGSAQLNFGDPLMIGALSLGSNFSQLVNDNWREFWTVLKPTFQERFGLLFLEFALKVFQKVPLDDVCPR